MNISEVFKNVHSDLKVENLIKLTKDNFSEFFELTIKEIKSYNELKDLLKQYDLDINNIYYTKNHLYCIWYIDDPVYYNLNHLFTLDKMTLEYINQYKKDLINLLNKNNWESFIIQINDTFVVDHFIRHYKEIPKEQIGGILCDIYSSREYILNTLSKEIIRECLDGIHVNEIDPDLIDSEGYINIYRGQTYDSTPLSDALSWTLDKSKAKWFANRFNSCGTVYKGKVKLKNVLAYIGHRDESEILVEYKHILNVKKIG